VPFSFDTISVVLLYYCCATKATRLYYKKIMVLSILWMWIVKNGSLITLLSRETELMWIKD